MDLTLRSGDTEFARDSEFSAWVFAAAPGESVTYARGFIAADKIGLSGLMLRDLALSALRFESNGYVSLVQRRMGEFRYEYVAIKRGEEAREHHRRRTRDQRVRAAQARAERSAKRRARESRAALRRQLAGQDSQGHGPADLAGG